jgi:hypothetical protein
MAKAQRHIKTFAKPNGAFQFETSASSLSGIKHKTESACWYNGRLLDVVPINLKNRAT